VGNGEQQAWWRVAVGGGAGMFVAMGLGRFSYTALLPALISSGRLSELEAGMVGGVNLFGFLVGAILSGRLAAGMQTNRRLRLWVWLCLLGLACSALPLGFAWLAWWRGVIGVMTGLIMIGGVALATAHVPEAKRAWAASMVFAGVGFGILLAGSVVPALVERGIDWAWAGLAAIGLVGTVVAQWGWHGDTDTADPAPPAIPVLGQPWTVMVVAHFLFSLGLVPHTLYWVDFIARDLGHGLAVGGLHWAVVGVFAVLGPWAMAWLAGRIGTARALVVSFAVLGAGLAAPALAAAVPALWASSVIFGAQPGVSALMAARVRDLGSADAMAALMRLMIMANAIGSGLGGLAAPIIFDTTGDVRPLFLAAAAMMLGAAWHLRRRAV